jgi:hypothetical protein
VGAGVGRKGFGVKWQSQGTQREQRDRVCPSILNPNLNTTLGFAPRSTGSGSGFSHRSRGATLGFVCQYASPVLASACCYQDPRIESANQSPKPQTRNRNP